MYMWNCNTPRKPSNLALVFFPLGELLYVCCRTLLERVYEDPFTLRKGLIDCSFPCCWGGTIEITSFAPIMCMFYIMKTIRTSKEPFYKQDLGERGIIKGWLKATADHLQRKTGSKQYILRHFVYGSISK